MTIVLACTKTAEPIIPVPEEEEKEEYTEQEKSIIYSNLFARYSLDIHYLWRDEIAEALTSWKLSDDPVSKVESVRYADDRWTMMTNDYNSLINTAGGISKSFGWELAPYYGDPTMTTVVAVILWTYPGTPAYEAGLKRGDAIVKVKGSTMTPQTYPKIFSEMLEGNNPVSITYKFERKFMKGCQIVLTGYEFVLQGTSQYWHPGSWTLSGSRDGKSWEVLDVQENAIAAGNRGGETVRFAIDESKQAPYRYYRLTVTKTSAYDKVWQMNMLGLREMRLLGKAVPHSSGLLILLR